MTSSSDTKISIDIKLLEKELNQPLDFDSLCMLCGTTLDKSNQNTHILPCNHKFHYLCLINYLKYDTTLNYSKIYNPTFNNNCPYCRNNFGYLPLKNGIKPLKNIHIEYFTQKIKSNKLILCSAIKKNGSKCNKICLKNNKLCGIHKKNNNLKKEKIDKKEKIEKKENKNNQSNKCKGIYIKGKKKGNQCSKKVCIGSKFGLCRYHEKKDKKI